MLVLKSNTSMKPTLLRYGEWQFYLANLRLLAHAGYDPREAVRLFAGSLATLEELDDGGKDSNVWWNMIKLWSWGSHPKAEDRVAQMSSELSTWESDQAGKAR